MNDERPIEKLLRRYAQKRRAEAGAPAPLHPATRRLLQGEVARQFPKSAAPTPKATPADLVTLWVRRWFYAAGLCVVLGLAATILFPGLWKAKPPAELASVSPADSAPDAVMEMSPAPADSAAPAVTPAPAAETFAVNAAPAAPSGGGNLVLREDRAFAGRRPENAEALGSVVSTSAEAKKESSAARKTSDNRMAVRSVAAPTPQPVPTVAPVVRVANEPAKASAPKPAGAVRSTRANLADGESASVARTQPATANLASAVPPTGTAYRAMTDKAWVARGGGAEKDAAPVYSQAFANIATDELQAKVVQTKLKQANAATPVLANFQVQQAGNQLRVIDQDGSTYLGEVPPVAMQLNATPKRAADVPKLATDLKKQSVLQQQKAEDFLYRVAGTNRTLRQQVVFTWNYVDLANFTANSAVQNSSAVLNFDSAKLPSQLPAVQNTLQNSLQNAVQNSFLNGRVQLGADKLIEINAVPVTP